MANDTTPVHKRGLEWLTSHALWEIGKYLVALIAAWVFSVGVSRAFHAALETAFNIFLIVIGLMGMVWLSVARFGDFKKKEDAPLEMFIFSPGIAVNLSPGIGRVFINLHFLSTKATELIFLHVTLRNNKGAYLDCESSEPIMIERMQVTSRTLDKKFPPSDLATFEKGEMVSLDGYAKVRDKGEMKNFRINISTIPSM